MEDYLKKQHSYSSPDPAQIPSPPPQSVPATNGGEEGAHAEQDHFYPVPKQQTKKPTKHGAAPLTKRRNLVVNSKHSGLIFPWTF